MTRSLSMKMAMAYATGAIVVLGAFIWKCMKRFSLQKLPRFIVKRVTVPLRRPLAFSLCVLVYAAGLYANRGCDMLCAWVAMPLGVQLLVGGLLTIGLMLIPFRLMVEWAGVGLSLTYVLGFLLGNLLPWVVAYLVLGMLAEWLCIRRVSRFDHRWRRWARGSPRRRPTVSPPSV